eukprot:GILK01004678.1.p1 GENE.GILK01004678.1~~GILK01004678.1.p1  ORF type:complete len:635 (+),score=110.53 GILK01004678.1:234-2138(+)
MQSQSGLNVNKQKEVQPAPPPNARDRKHIPHKDMGMKGTPGKDNSLVKYRLKIQPQPPKFPFANQYFDMSVYLVDERDRLKVGSKVPLVLKAIYEDHTPVDDAGLLYVNPETQPVVETTGMATLQVKLTRPSMTYGNKAFRLHVTTSGPDAAMIEPAISSAMIVIRHRLVISQQPPDVWYKDEGGRDKCISLMCTLVDENNNLVKTREVPLRVTLLYDNGTMVRKQSILKMSPDTKVVIGSEGSCTLKMRIEEVSKNHQNQGFCIKVEPDTSASPLNHDISFDLSSAITVRSKRNKKRKSNAMDSAEELGHVAAGPHGHNIREQMQSLSHVPISESSDAALKGVFQWSVEVMETFRSLEWQVIGYEFKADGMADPNRPIYRCPGCWSYKDSLSLRNAQHLPTCSIANLLAKYEKQTLLHLRTLYAQLDEGDEVDDRDEDFKPDPHLLQQQHSFSLQNPMDSKSSQLLLSHDMQGVAGNMNPSLSMTMPTLTQTISVTHGGQTPMGSAGMMPADLLNAGEDRVHFILAKDTQYGFAAFDSHRNPVGFYRLMEEPLGLHLMPIHVFGQSPKELEQIKLLFEDELARKSALVKSLHDCLTLDRLKEEALLCYWSQGIMTDTTMTDTSMNMALEPLMS